MVLVQHVVEQCSLVAKKIRVYRRRVSIVQVKKDELESMEHRVQELRAYVPYQSQGSL